MKSFVSFIIIGCFLVLSSCNEKTTDDNATIIRNCTGTYLHIDDKDYLVCNSSKLKAYADGTSLSVAYETIKNCNENEIVCMMYYPFEKTIKVTKIN